MAKTFSDKMFERLIQPLNLHFKRFDIQCNKMMNDLVTGDEVHVRKSFNQLNILASQRGCSTFPQKPRKRGKGERNEEYERQNIEETTERRASGLSNKTKEDHNPK